MARHPELVRFDDLLRSLDRTPYSVRNCLQFVAHVLDVMSNHDVAAMPTIPNLHPQTSLHSARHSWMVVRFLLRRFPSESIEIDGLPETLRAGDVILTKNDLGPEHILIAGVGRCELWHSWKSRGQDRRGGVKRTSLGWAIDRGIIRAWRPLISHNWFTSSAISQNSTLPVQSFHSC